jgi:hypothetical protein
MRMIFLLCRGVFSGWLGRRTGGRRRANSHG